MKKTLIGLSLSCLAGTVLAEEHTLTTYSLLKAPEYIDVNPAGLSVGDMYLRHQEISLSAGGPAAGEYYSQETIVFLDQGMGKSARALSMEIILQEGSIYAMDFVQTETANAPRGIRKHEHDGAIIGGTGAYAGIRGYYTLEIPPFGDEGGAVKTTYKYRLDK
ncbi:MAG: hypothetical protein ACO3P1_03970 [Pseudomonadales bacterium]|jgi:hypothetical protein